MPSAYYELIIRGNEDELIAYLTGYFNGKGIKDGYFFSEEHPIHLSHIRELIKYKGDVLHVICAAALRAQVESAIKKAPEDYEFDIKKVKKITRGYFKFKFETYNRQVAGNVKRLLFRRPPGVKLSDYVPEEIIDPSARATEGYAPLHHYTFKGKGVIEGNIAGVIALHEKISANQFVNPEDIRIHY